MNQANNPEPNNKEMKTVIYASPIRAEALNQSMVQASIDMLIIFLEINGQSKQAIKYLKRVEQLEQRITAGSFKN